MATRVFELAREIGVTSKDILQKCRAEGLEIKNHMSTLSAGLEATIREWFSEEAASKTAVESTEHVDIEAVRKKAKKSRRRKKIEPEPEPEPELEVPEEPAEPPATEVAVAQAPGGVPEVVAEASEPAAEADAEAVEEAVEEAQVPEQVEAAPSETTAPEAPAEPAVEAVEVVEAVPEAGDETPSPEVAEPQPQVAAEVKVEPEGEPEPQAESAPVPIKPAGPQVVPRPAVMKGPRVIRMEKPDFVSAPPPRRGPAINRGSGAARGAPTASESPTADGPGRKRRGQAGPPGESERGKTKRRSPRRRGGRTADSGEKLKEWRDRDLEERSARLAAASGGLRRHRPGASRKGGGGSGPAFTGKIEIDEPITVKSLSAATGLKSAMIIKQLMGMGTIATVNQVIGEEVATLVATEFGIELDVRRNKSSEEQLIEKLNQRAVSESLPRAPVVTFLGHVDHGKTSLLDYIRKTSVADGEAGGITQHIGAYRYDDGDKHVVFLDTPGHEAFTAMRARGANMTDVVVLVVAADDGVMPQTIEAISHAKASGVPILVALNKIDVPNANIQRALGQLAEHGLQPREWGGDTEVIHTSATNGDGMDLLLETLSLEAELLELKAEPEAPASGYVIEAEIKSGLGAVASLLVKDGTLRVGDVLLAGNGYGRVRQMTDSRGRSVEESGPATPVEVSGLDEPPQAGDRFYVLQDIDEARTVAEDRRSRIRAESLAGARAVTLDNLFSHIEAGDTDELNLIIKADVQGSIEALVGSLESLSTDEVRVKILHSGVGGVTSGDVTLAQASDAIIIGFNVVPGAAARQMAETLGIDIRQYRVIYEIIEDVRGVMEKGLAPEIRQETLGHANVRQVFKVSRLGTVAGCYVTDGVAQRAAEVRIIRNNVVIEDRRTLDSLKRFKDDAREVRAGMECGIKVAGYDDVKEGDVFEFYRQVEVARTL